MQEKTQIHAIRFRPGQDLKIAIQEFVNHQQIQAGWIVTCVGSLTEYRLRFANQKNAQIGKGFFEIISLSGTLSEDGCHLHIGISDNNGTFTGGHLLEGCKIYTTAEIIIGESADLTFKRENDGSTEWKELQIKRRERY